ncbi:MAG: hypoxanthine phosphoribosyltransferase [Clostridiaceae bacterium]|nr:hypoxanthine phosphoribosyltransferase [Clostridiaceae bacterium]
MGKILGETLISKEEIADICKELGRRITEDYAGKQVFLIGVLKGAFVFLADLARNIDLPVDMDFISVSSYGGGTQSTGVVRIIKDVDQNIAGKHVIVVEDIVDSGLTLNHLKQLLSTRKPASIALCTAFDKPERRKVPIEVEYVGRRIPDEFIVGYGLDYDGIYRNLPEVRILREAAEE